MIDLTALMIIVCFSLYFFLRNSDFGSLLASESLSSILPGIDKIDDGIAIYSKYYSIDIQHQYGVLALYLHDFTLDENTESKQSSLESINSVNSINSINNPTACEDSVYSIEKKKIDIPAQFLKPLDPSEIENVNIYLGENPESVPKESTLYKVVDYLNNKPCDYDLWENPEDQEWVLKWFGSPLNGIFMKVHGIMSWKYMQYLQKFQNLSLHDIGLKITTDYKNSRAIDIRYPIMEKLINKYAEFFPPTSD